MSETTVDLDNTSSRLSSIGSISFASVRDADAKIDYPPLSIIPLQGPISDEWFLLETIWLDVEESEADQIVVSSGRFGFYGVGDSVGEAVKDAAGMLLAYFEDLSETEDELPIYYRTHLAKLRSMLVASEE